MRHALDRKGYSRMIYIYKVHTAELRAFESNSKILCGNIDKIRERLAANWPQISKKMTNILKEYADRFASAENSGCSREKQADTIQ